MAKITVTWKLNAIITAVYAIILIMVASWKMETMKTENDRLFAIGYLILFCVPYIIYAYYTRVEYRTSAPIEPISPAGRQQLINTRQKIYKDVLDHYNEVVTEYFPDINNINNGDNQTMLDYRRRIFDLIENKVGLLKEDDLDVAAFLHGALDDVARLRTANFKFAY